MIRDRIPAWVVSLMVFTALIPCGGGAETRPVGSTADSRAAVTMRNRWLFIWRDMKDPKEVDRMIERFPRAKAAGYKGVVFSCDLAESKAAVLRQAAQRNGLDLIAIVMGGSHDRNHAEGLPVKDALFEVHGGKATLLADNPTHVLNAGFEEFSNNHFQNWSFQDDEGVTTFADHEVKHGGAASLRMENKPEHAHQGWGTAAGQLLSSHHCLRGPDYELSQRAEDFHGVGGGREAHK